MKKKPILLVVSVLLLFAILPIACATDPVHDVAVTDLDVWPTSANPGELIDIDVTVENQGDFRETFDVLVYADRLGGGSHIDIGSETVTLDVGNSDTLFFIWDTTDVPSGSYWVTAEAVLPGDADPEDNTRRVLVEIGPVHDVAVTDLDVWPTSVFIGEPIDIDVTVENQGDFPETFDVLVYADRLGGGSHIDIGSETVTLDVGNSDTLFFIWDTTDVPSGSYWVTAEAVLPGDADPEDNTRRVLVGGIFPRPTPRQENIFDLLASWGPVIVLMVGLGSGPILIFEILMSVRPQWPWRLSKRRAHDTAK